MINKIIISDKIGDKEYVGHVTIQKGKYIASIHQVPEANKTEVFFDHYTEIFDTYEDAEEYVYSKWKEIFGKREA